MMKKRRWLWITLFISVALLLGALATGWNMVLVRDYHRIVSMAKNLALSDQMNVASFTHLVLKMILGTLGFVTTLTLILFIFIGLLKEMRLNQIQSEFLATISHELKTPLSAIELCGDLLRKKDLTESEKEELWDSYEMELKRLREEVESLLEAARWQSATPFFQKTQFSLEDWIQRSWPNWQRMLGPDFTLTRKGSSLDLIVQADPHMLDLIIQNILNNAKKFSGSVRQAEFRTRLIPPSFPLKRARWIIQVEDQGWGFEPTDSKKIFNRFYRSKNLAPYAIPGTGLGLYIAQTAGKNMHLKLRAQSEGKQRGSIFSIEGRGVAQ